MPVVGSRAITGLLDGKRYAPDLAKGDELTHIEWDGRVTGSPAVAAVPRAARLLARLAATPGHAGRCAGPGVAAKRVNSRPEGQGYQEILGK